MVVPPCALSPLRGGAGKQLLGQSVSATVGWRKVRGALLVGQQEDRHGPEVPRVVAEAVCREGADVVVQRMPPFAARAGADPTALSADAARVRRSAGGWRNTRRGLPAG